MQSSTLLLVAFAILSFAACAMASCQVQISQTQAGSWASGSGTQSQWNGVLSNTGSEEVTVVSYSQSGASISQIWGLQQSGNPSDRQYTTASWARIPAGQTFQFGYIIDSAQPATFTRLSVQCANTVVPAIDMGAFCDDSQRDPEWIDANTWNQEIAVFNQAYETFQNLAANSNFVDVATQDNLGFWLRNYTATLLVGKPNRPTGFTITRSTGLIIINAVSNPPSNNVGIENHNLRYEFMKAQLCRDFGSPIVYEQYYNERLSKYSRFYTKAMKVGVPSVWHGFRMNFNAYVAPSA